ncbi:MAG: DUF11 domain-containing protein [Thiotrichales bacterium]|nr:MAG: DUF11 domain-containing protein [Thiotrichales bacterium]
MIKIVFITAGLLLPVVNAFAAPCDIKNNPPPFIEHDITNNVNTSASYCELCGYGYVTIVVSNPYEGADMINMTVVEDLGSSGLVYDPLAPNPISYTMNGIPIAGPAPTGAGSILTFNLAGITLNSLPGNNNIGELTITFAVRRTSNQEGLVSANRNIRASLNYSTNQACAVTPQNTGFDLLPLREPVPTVDKRGRNVDASQGGFSNNVFGNINDDVIWRIRIGNNGLAGLQDLQFDDLMTNGNFQINYACPTAGEANAIANNDGVGPFGNCVNASNTINNFNVDNPFGDTATSPDGYEVDVTAGGTTDIYLVGKITTSCNPNTTNTVSGIEWGCEADGPTDGGISVTSTGASPGSDTSVLSSLATNNSGLQVIRELTGLNTSQPVGGRGRMRIRLRNVTGGSIKNIQLRDVLPPEYVVDPTYTPTISMNPRYGNYDGMIDTITWTNPAPNTFPLTSTNPAEPLANTAPEFDLTSSTSHPIHGDQVNMMRHGDIAWIEFRVVMIPPAYYDNNANLDVRVEDVPDTTDPDNSTTLNNQLVVDFEDFCNPGNTRTRTFNDTFPSDPEDLDINITGPGQLVFILTNNPAQPLPLQVALTNNGGHFADDFTSYVSFGPTMEVVSAPGNCSVAVNPPPLEVWDNPSDIPANATVYECSRSTGVGTIAPNQTRTLDFEVIKTSDPARLAADDLSFRADVVGEITLEDGTLLWFPTPANVPIANRANNYSLDAVRARVIGFNLVKDQVGSCTENNPPPAIPDLQVQLGEECTFHIETGGWFGFQTPGFAYIAVLDITVTDEFPDGQGYISSTDPALTSDITIQNISLTPQTSPPLQPLDEGWIDWSFNQTQRITVRDQWFRVDVTSRLLNDPIDAIDPADPNNPGVVPNRHAVASSNVLNSTFQAVFFNDILGIEQIFTLGPGTIGYPQESIRREDLTITEPNILVTKEVCNENLYGVGTGCTNFVPLADDGDTQDNYIYRVTLTNEASSVGVARAPAYNLTSTDVLDASDLVLVVPFNTDGLDNDGDGLIDAADPDGEGSISDNVISNGTPATITFSHTHSSGLLRINPGASVTLYYRVDPDDAIAPLQQLINTVTASFDSLEGDSGNQTVVQSANSTIGGARVYGTVPASATVQILPLQTQPKDIVRLSNTPLAAAQPQPVSIGEEIEYELRTFIPVANLRDFFVRDELPPGISCKEAPVVNLDAPPYSAAGFFPGGQITPTCNDNLVYWYFGDQELTTATNNNLFEFVIGFIARVDNTATVNDTDVISNGAPATNAFVSYINEANSQITINFDQADLVVNEPQIALTKTFESNVNDAGDVITVTVTATNTGTATAYNLRVFDDLAAVSNLTFLGNVGGTDPPDNTDTTTFGGNRPVFSWNPANPDFAIAPGATVSFTFDISADIGAQPLEILDNTIQASWTSLPSQSTALNSGGAIGANGAVDGMRIGNLPNLGDAINDYEATATAFTVVPAVSMTKTDLNPALAAEIGAHRNFEVVVLLPEGTTTNLAIADQLNFAGISYVLSNNANFDISYSFENIVSINGSPPGEAVFTAFPADNTSGVASWNIGQVVTASEDDTTGTPALIPAIRINYYARANNDLNTNSGTTLQNTATTNYSNGETGAVVTITDNTPVVTVTEPVLTVSKTATLITPLPVTGGDIVEYVITVPNSGNATAWDANLVDTIPPQLELDPGFTPTATIDGTPVTGFVATPAGAPDGPLVWGAGNADSSLEVPAGSTLVLTYRAVVDATTQSNITLDNSVLVDWTSLQGASTYERTGVGCPVITAPDDYCAGPAVATINTTDNNSLTKTIVSDTFAPANDATVRIGDTVTYRLALDLQEGTTRTVAVTDVLPAGLAFVDIVSINGDTAADFTPPVSGAGSNFGYAPITAAAVPAAGQTGALSFSFGDVINDPAGDATTDTLVIEYRARVVENVLAQVPSTALVNTATLSYVDGNGAPVIDPARLESSATLTVLQPVMTAPTKTDRSGRTSPTNVNIATDVMNFTLESCNTTGLAPAYSLQLTDVLAMQLDESSLTGPVNGPAQPDVIINGVAAVAGVDYTYTPPAARGGSFVISLSNGVNPGQCVTVNYDIGFYTDFGPNQSWDNAVTVDEYWSLPLQSGQRYGPLGPAIFSMTNVANIEPASKAMLTPASGEITVGEEVVYRIAVPSLAANAALYDVVITDALHPSLEYLSATEISGTGLVMVDNTVAPGNVSLSFAQIPAGQQAVIELRARVANNASANAGTSFTNTAGYTYAISAGGAVIVGGTATTANSLTIVEPLVSINKSVVNLTSGVNPTTAGDLLRYTLTLTAAGAGPGDNFSDAFDIRIDDSLGMGLAYQAGTVTVSGVGNTIADPVVNGDGVNTAQTLTWDLASATGDIDIGEGGAVTVTYDVIVLDNVLANQALTNSATAQWTGLDGIDANERTGVGTPVVNDYFTAPVTTTLTTPDNTALTKSRLTDTFGPGDAVVRIGDIVEYELRATLQEGQYSNLVLNDTLPQGVIFEAVVQINGDTSSPYAAAAPFVHADIATPVVSGNPLTGPSTVSFNIGTVTNPSDNNAANDDFVIVYRARVLNNVFAQVNTTTLTNNAQLIYATAAGAATRAATTSITLLQPVLNVAKSAAPAGGDTVVEAGELVTYTVDVTNNGLAPAYDLVLEDTIPVGMRNGAATVTTLSATLLGAGTVLPNPTPAYNAATGVASWNLGIAPANTYTIPPGETLRLVYQVQADPDLGAGLTLTNAAVASLYYSFDNGAVPTLGGVTGVAEIYGPSNTATTTLTSPTPGALQKVNPADLTVSVGETFTYRITVPATPLNIALHDVRIIDDLTASAADLSFVSVTKVAGSLPWTPVNSGNATSLVIEDVANGIDIPANEQVVVDVTVRVDDTATNVSGLLFNNTASYTYNQLPGNAGTQQPGAPDTTGDMTIVGPDNLTMVKTGPAQMRIGNPDVFTLNVHNTGTATAWDLTISDLLPNLAPGGMCDTAPTILTAQVFLADGTTAVSAPLVQGTDFVATFTGEPACSLTITMQTPAAAIPADNRLIITYQSELDTDTPSASVLTNVAGATQWFSQDTAGAGATGATRTYTRTLTDGTVALLDHEDAHTVNTVAPIVSVQKRVVNMTTGQDPGSNAQPGDTLRYSILIRNTSAFDVPDFSFVDELDALNATPAFAAGSLNLVTVPVGADVTATSATGGASGTGLVDIRNLSLGVAGSPTESVLIVFDVTLAPVITSGTVVLNQGRMQAIGLDLPTDDPNVNGADNPAVMGDEDPTQTLISSAPQFEVFKTSQDLSGDPNMLLSGDTLRYTITVRNVGSENAVNATLRDQLPANTTYVAGSTRLNGAVVADLAGGVLPLQNGILINALENTTPGFMRADTAATANNRATISFDVVINNNVVNGTVISNQAFLLASGAGSGPMPDTPSDDPATPVPDDPTLDVVGNQPLVDAHKTVAIVVDNGSPGIVDPGDRLRYTISISNMGATPATGVTFVDAVPANTTYFANSVTLNGLPVGQPDGGVSPLILGIDVSSPDLPPPTAGNGTLSAGASAVVTFDVDVNGGVPAGTIISNQGSVDSNELPAELTDADGIDSNGDQPTVIAVGNAQLLAITKQVVVVGGGPALAGGQLEYRVRVTNIGSVAATNVVITDNLDLPVAGQLGYISGSGLLNGLPAGVNFTAPVITADFSSVYGNLQPGLSAELRFLAQIDTSLPIGTTIVNTADVSWNTPAQTASASVSIDVGGTPGVANLNGALWHDANYNNVADSGEVLLQGWSVDIYRSGQLLGTFTTDATGVYQFNGLLPNDVGTDRYELRFRAPGAGSNTAMLGMASSPFVNGLQTITDIVVSSGGNAQNLSLPIDPNGVVYNSVIRTPVAGATLTMLNASNGNTPLPASCFDDPAQQNQVTLAGGYYKFDLNFSDAACSPGDAYQVQVIPPANGFVGTVSQIVPPTLALSDPAFSVIACPGGVDDRVSTSPEHCEIQASVFAPPASVAPRTPGTAYYLKFTLGNGTDPYTRQIFNNHIPLDPELDEAVAISKTSSLLNVTRSQLVPYTITVNNSLSVPLTDMDIVDTFPAGFKYVAGSARIDGLASEPVINGLQMTWPNLTVNPGEIRVLKMLLIVGSGVSEGEYINRVQAVNNRTGEPVSAEAQATVRVIPDPTFDCTDVIGKVFEDRNMNGYQDDGEPGIPSARVVTARGLEAKSDEHGRFHIACAVVPNENRGSNFILKLDDRSLPSGYRITTENPRVERATRGKMLKFNFGASIHRVVRLDMADAVFEPNSTEIRPQWLSRLSLLMEKLVEAPSVLRLAYMADTEDPDLVEDRLRATRKEIQRRWADLDCCYTLEIETEIFWRRGKPAGKGAFR